MNRVLLEQLTDPTFYETRIVVANLITRSRQWALSLDKPILFVPYFFKINCNTPLPSTCESPMVSFREGSLLAVCMHFPFLPSVQHFCTYYPLWFAKRNNVWRRVNIMDQLSCYADTMYPAS
jgi:hypothetical protein